jgi:hypothetical protein
MLTDVPSIKNPQLSLHPIVIPLDTNLIVLQQHVLKAWQNRSLAIIIHRAHNLNLRDIIARSLMATLVFLVEAITGGPALNKTKTTFSGTRIYSTHLPLTNHSVLSGASAATIYTLTTQSTNESTTMRGSLWASLVVVPTGQLILA